jgi:hypothetical protein
LIRFFSTALSLVLLATVAAGLASCGKSNSGGSGGNGNAAGQASGIDRAAQDAALTEVKKHWAKTPEGWITARTSGSPFAPDHFLRQLRELTVEGVHTADLTESDRMNGFVGWRGGHKHSSTTWSMDSMGRFSAGAFASSKGQRQLAN